MNEELVQNAVKTFCIVPEAYQKVYQQMGANFPDELVDAVKKNPDGAIKMLESDENLLTRIVEIYSKYRDQIDKQASMFKNGGKLNYLLNKFQEGGPFIIGPAKPNFRQKYLGGYRNRLQDEPGISRRSLTINVDPNTGEQRYSLEEDVRGNTAESVIEIPHPGDTLVTQKVATRDGYSNNVYKKGSDGYRSIVDRLIRTGAPKYVNSIYSKTN